ncbi:MAG: type III pantothenate kinase [Gammaproteobacteria bacterium]|nr:type III pantothenate kinase [Gammaproteobacteria bacterium]
MSEQDRQALELLIDVGNTRCKWQLRDAGGTLLAASVSDSALSKLPANIFRDMQRHYPDASALQRVRVALVRGAEDQRILNQALAETFNCPIQFAQTQNKTLGLKNSYSQPSQMGVDRWCAVIAAAAESGIPGAAQAMCVVDAGSAVTIDWIDPNGRHLGGYITPGYAMQLRTLLSGTGKVFANLKADASSIELASDTHNAVHSGILASIVSHINGSLDRQRSRVDGNVRLFLTGGDAELLMPYLQEPLHRPDLVLDGLALLLP